MNSNRELFTNKYFIGENEYFSIWRVNECIKENQTFHTHEFIEICYVMSGTGTHIIENETFTVRKGDVFIINNDIAHSFYIETENEELTTYNILFNPEFLDEKLINFNDFNTLPKSYLFKNLWDDSAVKADIHILNNEQESFDSLVLNMYHEYIKKDNAYMILLRAYLIELIVKLIRCISVSENQYYTDKRKETVNNIITHLKENYPDCLNLDEITKKSLFSKNYFCRVFKQYTGKTVFEYLNLLRINEACNLLRISDRKLTDISLSVGFTDYKFFVYCFKRYTGKKPSEYRKSIY